MFQEKEILDKMEEYQTQNNLECAEAWFLASRGLSPEKISENLRVKYSSAEGYAKFKEVVEEMSGEKVMGDYQLKLGQDVVLVNAPITDVDDSFSNVVENAFLVKVAGSLQEEMRKKFQQLSKDDRLVAEILRRRSKMGLSTSIDLIWEDHAIITEKPIPEPQKRDIL